MIDRAQVLGALEGALAARADVHALWEAGSAAFGAVDAWSDVDVSVVADDDAVAALWPVIEAALAARSPIAHTWIAPEPAWHGHAQRVYRLRDAPEHLLVDVAIMKRSSDDKFVDPEQHGRARVIFDRIGASAARPFDEVGFRARMARELARARATLEMFDGFVEKELARGRLFDAMHFWNMLVLRPLVLVLGVRYRPLRFDFFRYTSRDLPPAIADELAALYFVRDPDDLRAKHARARALYAAAIDGLDVDAIDLTGLARVARS